MIMPPKYSPCVASPVRTRTIDIGDHKGFEAHAQIGSGCERSQFTIFRSEDEITEEPTVADQIGQHLTYAESIIINEFVEQLESRLSSTKECSSIRKEDEDAEDSSMYNAETNQKEWDSPVYSTDTRDT